MNVDTKDIYKEHTVPASGKPSILLGFFASAWLKQDQKGTRLHRDAYRRAYFSIEKENLQIFVVQDQHGSDIVTVWIANIAYDLETWDTREYF